MSQIFFHTTPTRNWQNIQNEGLVPTIGPRSKQLSTEKDGVFMFVNEEALDDALSNWLGDQFDCSEELVTMKVTLPDDFPIEISDAAYEVISRTPVPSKFLSFHRND